MLGSIMAVTLFNFDLASRGDEVPARTDKLETLTATLETDVAALETLTGLTGLSGCVGLNSGAVSTEVPLNLWLFSKLQKTLFLYISSIISQFLIFFFIFH